MRSLAYRMLAAETGVDGAPPYVLTGSYDLARDFTLTLNHDTIQLPDQTVMSLSETWQKQSDSPVH